MAMQGSMDNKQDYELINFDFLPQSEHSFYFLCSKKLLKTVEKKPQN